MEKVKLSILKTLRTQAMAERTSNEYTTEGMSEDEIEAYRRGFIGGWSECLGKLVRHRIIKIVID